MTDEDWTPPTEADMKILTAKRERNDKISKLMGQYLLKGNKMLATTCKQCGTIEMEEKSGRVFCVGCQDVDSGGENAKDNPVLRGNRPEQRQEVVEPIIVPQRAYMLGSAKPEQRQEVVEPTIVPQTAYLLGSAAAKPEQRQEVVEPTIVPQTAYLLGSGEII